MGGGSGGSTEGGSPPAPASALGRALAEYGLEGARVEPIAAGLIHETYAVDLPAGVGAPGSWEGEPGTRRSGGPDRRGDAGASGAGSGGSGEVGGAGPGWVLQRVSPIFAPGIHENIRVVTDHLRRRAVPVPALLPTRTGALCAELGREGRWRLWTRLPGVSFDVCRSPAQARSAGALVGRFHAALDDLDVELRPLGIVLHDPLAHLGALRAAVAEGGEHPLHRAVSELARKLASAAGEMEPPAPGPRRIVHGDLKLTNLLFAAGDPERAVALLDLDTLSRLPRWMDLADALRSWCNPRGEDCEEAVFDPALHRAAVEGYLEEVDPDPAEREALVQGLEWLCLELAARFAADALRECYFAWDPARFATRGEHALVRARGQRSLYSKVCAMREERRRHLGLAGSAAGQGGRYPGRVASPGQPRSGGGAGGRSG